MSKEMAADEEVVIPEGWEPLPRDPNYTSPGYCMFKNRGWTCDVWSIKWGVTQQLALFQGRPSDIIVASFPKSGTTWLQEIVWRVTHRHASGAGKEPGVCLEYRFPLLEIPSQEKLMEMTSLHDMSDQRFIKTHLHYHVLPDSVKTSRAKVLYVYRDARDVCVSFYKFARLLNLFQYRGTFADFRDNFMRGEIVCGPYREHVQGYLEHSDTVLCLSYEQMHQDRGSVVRKVADFLGVSLSDADVDDIVKNTSFEVMKANPDTNFRHWEDSGMVSGTEEGTFMRKGVVGDWRNYFTEEESEAFLKWRNEKVASLE